MTAKKIITHCAPTLAGLKTANLFNEPFTDKDELLDEINSFNEMFSEYGIKMIPLSFDNNVALIYVYRIKDLQNDFGNVLSQELLTKYGYESNDIVNSINRLGNRINAHKDFPHEIGLFLGYPPEDVKGFIDNKAQNYKCVGYWKVYGDEQKAIECFRKYRRCQQIFLSHLELGFSLKQLVIQK